MAEFETEVIDVITRTPNVKSFRFKVKGKAEFKAGQYFFVTIKINNIEKTKHFSFSNSPTENKYIEFTKRITSSEFSSALNGLKKCDWAKIRMPYGSFTLDNKYKKIAFLSGGIGITPIRSICKYALDKELDTDISLLYGNNKEDDIIFKVDLDEMSAKNKKIRVVYTLTSPGTDNKNWKGRIGYIDEKMIPKEIPDYKERVFYICGPPQMVEGLTNILKDKLYVKESNIKKENFAGYR